MKRGFCPGIYRSWEECQAQVKGFADAKFKKFSLEKDALNYLSATEEIITSYPTTGLAVDASLLKKDTQGEFQIFDLEKKEMIFKSEVFKNTTVNVMEFLAIVKALQISADDISYWDCPIYSDSATALTWVYNKKINSKIELTPVLEVLVKDALDFLNTVSFNNKLLKWNTHIFNDIPADFHRK